MMSAPVFIVCVADIRSRIKEYIDLSLNENSPQQELKQIIRDTSIAVEHLVLLVILMNPLSLVHEKVLKT